MKQAFQSVSSFLVVTVINDIVSTLCLKIGHFYEIVKKIDLKNLL